jgi:PAS domain-containing protein
MVDRHGIPRHTLAVIVDVDAQATEVPYGKARTLSSSGRTSPDGILLNDMRGMIVMANQQLATMLGYDTGTISMASASGISPMLSGGEL